VRGNFFLFRDFSSSCAVLFFFSLSRTYIGCSLSSPTYLYFTTPTLFFFSLPFFLRLDSACSLFFQRSRLWSSLYLLQFHLHGPFTLPFFFLFFVSTPTTTLFSPSVWCRSIDVQVFFFSAPAPRISSWKPISPFFFFFMQTAISNFLFPPENPDCVLFPATFKQHR